MAISNQLLLAMRRLSADFIVDTSSSIAEAEAQIDRIIFNLTSERSDLNQRGRNIRANRP